MRVWQRLNAPRNGRERRVAKIARDLERERIIDLVEHWLVNDEQHIPRLCGGCDFIALIKGEKE